jgi:hypothetical protein
MKQTTILAGMVAGSLLLGALVVTGGNLMNSADPSDGQLAEQTPGPGLPWQIEVRADGSSRVMGLTLSAGPEASTLADVRRLFGTEVQIAVIAAPGEDGSLEAFVDPAQLGFVSGKLVVTARVDVATLRGLRERAIKSDFMESATRKYMLAPADETLALAAPIFALSFIPQAKLDEAAILARFGQPARRIRSDGHLEHFLYPDRGLDIILDTEGKELMQYVAPADFSRLSAPLDAAVPRPPSSAASRP